MTRYLLDTNIVSDLVRNPQGAIARRIAAVGEANVCTSIIVAAELRYGAAKKNSPELQAQVRAVIDALDVLPFEGTCDQSYAEIRTKLESERCPIGGNDLLIAAHALSLGYTVVTDNEREFSRVQKLVVTNWLNQT